MNADVRRGQEESAPDPNSHGQSEMRRYLLFAGMIFTSMLAMFAVMYLNTFEWSHVQWSETRFYMTLLMGATMATIMLAFMLSMYGNWKVNAAIFGGAVAIFIISLFLVRSQTTVQDRSYMAAMIPHHSIAILTSERSEISDVRVCELAVRIIEAQRREIDEMEWLLDDIAENGLAATPEIAARRPVPKFIGTATRTCG